MGYTDCTQLIYDNQIILTFLGCRKLERQKVQPSAYSQLKKNYSIFLGKVD